MSNCLKLKSGFSFDYDNLFGEGKVTEKDIQDLQDKIVKAHQAISHMRKTGEIRGHLSKDGTPEKVLFSQLPYIEEGHLNSPSSIQRLKEFGEEIRQTADVVISFGIGGSYLGNKVLFDVQCGEFWNLKSKKERNGYPEVYFSGNNIDARRMDDLLKYLTYRAAVTQSHEQRNLVVVMLVISKSGSTLEPMSNFLVLYENLLRQNNIVCEIVAVTDPNEQKPTLLKKLAIENNWKTFAVPDGVGGRFSVFCEVGLSLAACIGFDIEAFLNGAKDMDLSCQSENCFDNPALLNAVLKFIASEKYGRDLEVMMPYGDYLKSFSEWYIQLLAESLGKTTNREGEKVFYGRTPIVAVGTTDMHAQTQQHQEGKLNKVVQFVKIEEWEKDFTIKNLFPKAEGLKTMSGVKMSQALEVARQSNAEALASNQRFNSLFTLPKCNAYFLGQLMYLLALSVAYEGELANVDAFNQPGVEAYKRIMTPKLKALKHE